MRVLMWMLATILMLSACVVEGGRKTDPVESARSRVAIAAEYLQKGELDQAQRHLQKALQLDPKSPEAYNILGALLEKDGDRKKAEDNYRKAISLKPDYTQAHFNYGVLLFKQERYPEAEKQFAIAGEDIAYDHRANALENLGLAQLAQGDKPHAQVAFERALRVDSFMVTSALELAALALDRRDTAVANVYYQRYVKALGPGAVQGPRGLAIGIRIGRLTGDQKAAAGYAGQLRAQYPESPEYREYQQGRDAGS